MSRMQGCELCHQPGGLLVHRSLDWRVVRVADAAFPAFYRVIWNAHRAEFSDLDAAQRRHCLDAVAVVEQALRHSLAPTKINLASLGNVVPHLHWHVVARFDWDSHYPNPIWAQPQREVVPPPERRLALPLATLDARVAAALHELAPAVRD